MTFRLEPRLDSGSLLDFYSVLWGPYYAAVLSILGPTGTILPIGDPRHGQPNAASFKTTGAEQLTFSWSKAPSLFDTPLDLTRGSNFQGIIPFVTFNGADEGADSPDAPFWTRGDGTNDGPFSIGLWVNVSDATSSALIAKWDAIADIREWQLWLDASDRPEFLVLDESANAFIGRRDATAFPENVWVFIVATYSGSGAISGVKLYLDGVRVDDTDRSGGAYTAMESQAVAVTLAHRSPSSPDLFADLKMAGAPLGPFDVWKELSGDEVLQVYEIGRRALAY